MVMSLFTDYRGDVCHNDVNISAVWSMSRHGTFYTKATRHYFTLVTVRVVVTTHIMLHPASV